MEFYSVGHEGLCILNAYLELLSKIVICLGIVAVVMTWRSIVHGSAANLSMRMFEINKLEIKNPAFFDSLGDNNKLAVWKLSESGKQEAEVLENQFEEAIQELVAYSKSKNYTQETRNLLRKRMSVIFSKSLEMVSHNYAGSDAIATDEMAQKLSHYLFILFSFYEQVFIIRRVYLGCYHNPWKERFNEHMRKRPLFRMYWYAVYRDQSTSKFKQIVKRVEAEKGCWGRFNRKLSLDTSVD